MARNTLRNSCWKSLLEKVQRAGQLERLQTRSQAQARIRETKFDLGTGVVLSTWAHGFLHNVAAQRR